MKKFVQADKVEQYALDFYRSTMPIEEEQVVHFYYTLGKKQEIPSFHLSYSRKLKDRPGKSFVLVTCCKSPLTMVNLVAFSTHFEVNAVRSDNGTSFITQLMKRTKLFP